MKSTIYDSFLTTISKKFEAQFNEISVINNFDYGDEYEVALCKCLRVILPDQYGICRGSIFSSDGSIVGDDIIIYDQLHYPTLRLLDDATFAQKQKIPFEAVFAYIEAKNTICIDGMEANSFEKAWSQAISIKNLKRKPVSFNKYSVNGIPFLKRPDTWPEKANPIYTAIFSKGVRRNKNGEILSSEEASVLLSKKIYEKNLGCIQENNNSPDLFIADKNLLYIPTINNSLESPHFINRRSVLSQTIKNNIAYGLGLSLMFYAFDFIELGKIHWPAILSDGLEVPEIGNINI